MRHTTRGSPSATNLSPSFFVFKSGTNELGDGTDVIASATSGGARNGSHGNGTAAST